MRVCFISHGSARGGAERSLLELVSALTGRGASCVCLLPDRGPLQEILAAHGADTEVVPFKWWVHAGRSFPDRVRRRLPLRHLPGVKRLVAAIRRSGCDVVCTNTIAVGAGAVAAKIAGKPHVWCIREFGFDDHGLSYDLGSTVARRLIGRLSAACIANSRAVADAYRPHLGDTELAVVYNAVDVPDPAGGPPEETPWRHDGAIRCVLVGTMLPGKGHEDALQAMVHLRDRNVPAELLLLGGGGDAGYRRRIAETIDRDGLADRVHVVGPVDAPIPVMNTADVVLVCSRREAFGRVTVEGMKLGKPVVATDRGGTPEIVDDGETGFLYEPGDARALAARIAKLHVDPACREAVGAEARRRAGARFNRETYGAEFEAILRRVAGTATAPGRSAPGLLDD